MKKDSKNIIEFIGNQVEFNKHGDACFWGTNSNNQEQMIAEIRAYGAIRKLFLDDDRKPNPQKEEQFQKELGDFIAEAITEKIQREKDL